MTATKTMKSTFREINLSEIDRPVDIVRIDINKDELEELARSIKERGLLQPIGVTPRDNRYMIVYGDRRYLAHRILDKKKIECRVENITDAQVMLDRAMENLQRVNLTPLEEGQTYRGLIEKGELSIEELSHRYGKSAGTIQRRMDILRMPDSFQKALHEKSIGISVAEELWSCPDAARREYFLELAVEHGITRDVARMWVDEFKKAKRSQTGASEDGRGPTPAYEDVPIYRACDICRDPVDYKNIVDLRICPECGNKIKEASR